MPASYPFSKISALRKFRVSRPPRVEYRLSEFGQTLAPVLDAIAQWGVDNNRQIVEIMQEQAA